MVLAGRAGLLSLLACALRSLVAAAASPCLEGGLYKDWVSPLEVFVRTDQPKGLLGLHIACVWQEGGKLVVEAYKDAVDVGDPPEGPYELPGAAGRSWTAFRRGIRDALQVTKETNQWGHLELKQPFGVFNPEGARLKTVGAALKAKLIFVVVGGQWFWPPVREGYVRQLASLGIELETLSVQPVAYRVRGFLKEHECEEIVRLGGDRMQSSPVSLMDKDKGKAAKEFRTSTQAFIGKSESKSLRDIDKRVAKLTRVPKDHNEDVQILRYEKTQYYSAHLDNWDPMFYSDASWFEFGHKNRFITVFWYLTSVEEGGETIFPRALGLPQPMDMWSCAEGLKVKPVRGTVIFWYSLHPNGNTDPNGLHAACPVEVGQKWSANYWVWNKPRFGKGTAQEEQEEDGPKEDNSDFGAPWTRGWWMWALPAAVAPFGIFLLVLRWPGFGRAAGSKKAPEKRAPAGGTAERTRKRRQ